VTKIGLFLAFLLPAASWAGDRSLASDPTLSTAGAPYAPLDAKNRKDPTVPMSGSEREELMSEFRGLVALGLQPQPFEKWQGRSMADCYAHERSEAWRQKCEIITGQGRGWYYFYPNEARGANTLQHLDIRLDVGDTKLVEDANRQLRGLLGSPEVVPQDKAGVRAKGAVRHWNTGKDVADLYIDVSETPEGRVRFVWKRSPLVAGGSARLRTRTDN
jgi:hypothetical protein